MVGVLNRVPHMVFEVGTCFVEAAFTERISVIPGDLALRQERHQIVLCDQHGADSKKSRLLGTITAYGEQVAQGA